MNKRILTKLQTSLVVKYEPSELIHNIQVHYSTFIICTWDANTLIIIIKYYQSV